ncbi:MAG: cupin domain-containing protein [Actinomycetota bacterium]|nr:cupin domain-containing protein [Actinomycetota bacterium]
MILPGTQRRYIDLPGRRSADPLKGTTPHGFSIRVVSLSGGRRSAHRHPGCQEVIFVIAGSGRLWEDGIFNVFEQGDSALIEPGVAHATIPDPGTAMELVCFFPVEDVASATEELEDVVVEDERA